MKLILDLAEKVLDNIAIKIGSATGGWKRGKNHPLPTKKASRSRRWTGKQSVARQCYLASRQKADDAIDYAVGFSEIEKVGEHVDVDEPLLSSSMRVLSNRSTL